MAETGLGRRLFRDTANQQRHVPDPLQIAPSDWRQAAPPARLGESGRRA